MKKSIYFFILLSLLMLTLWNCCKDNGLNIITNPESKTNLEKENVMLKGYITKEQMLDTFIVVESKDPPDKAFDCKTMIIEGWTIHHFEPKAGKKLGIWATNGNWYTQPARLTELSGTFGFSYIFHPADLGITYFNQAVANGFSSTNIMVTIKPPANWQDRIDEYGNVLGYYWDEPYTDGFSLSIMSNVFSHVHANTTTKLVISDYKPSTCFDPYAFLSDEIMVSAYSNWYESVFTCVFFEGGSDQRQLWDTMKSRYSSRNLSNWISSYKDLGEFSNLTGKAANLGINTLWLYQLDEQYASYFTQKNHIMQFCNSAWYNGFLRRFSQYTTYYYRCLDADCATCESEEGNWVLYKTIKGAIREDFPQ